MSDCRHERLTFNCGGLYVVCCKCGAPWIAKKPGLELKLDYERGWLGLGPEDVREAQ